MSYQTIEFRLETFYVLITILFLYGMAGYIEEAIKWIMLKTHGYKGDYKHYTKKDRKIKCNKVWNIGIWKLYKWIKEGEEIKTIMELIQSNRNKRSQWKVNIATRNRFKQRGNIKI